MFSCCYAYQMVSSDRGPGQEGSPRDAARPAPRFAVLIPARNEEMVISGLIDSIHRQDYPTELIDIYVIADNCTDSTAARAIECGAKVIARFNNRQVGKGMRWTTPSSISTIRWVWNTDAFLVFDADNVLTPVTSPP